MAIIEPECPSHCRERVIYQAVPVFIENDKLEKTNAQLKRENASLHAEIFRLRQQGRR